MGKAARVLYIEDDDSSQRLVARLLGGHGYEVLLADDGLQGISLAREARPDLVLVDIELPHIDGRSLTTRLRSIGRFATVPIVALTADDSPGSREMALAAGCTGFLTKPIDVGKFPQQIETFLKGHHESAPAGEHYAHLERHAQEVVAQLEKKIRELKDANHRLYRQERMKSDFLTVASHELRTPLTLISGYGTLLEKKLKAAEGDKEVLAPIIATTEGLNSGIVRLQQVVDEIIRVSRVSAGLLDLEVGPVLIGELLEKIYVYFRSVCVERDVALHVDDLSALPPIHADGEQVQIAIENVVGNAIKYTPDGGDIYVSVREEADQMDLMVRDTGIGIPREEQQRIFEQFYALGSLNNHSTSKYAFRGGGLGMGLAIVKGIMEAHNGRVWVDSPGQDEETLPGSTFHLVFPIQPPTASSTYQELIRNY